MWRRLAFVIGLLGFAMFLDGCTKCGPIWEDWIQPSRSCRSDHLPAP